MDEKELQLIYQVTPSLDYTITKDIVSITKTENHWFQRLVRKLNINIPQTSTISLDSYGSFIFQQIDGKKTVAEIGELLGENFEEANEQLYERLILYLSYLAFEKKYIFPV